MFDEKEPGKPQDWGCTIAIIVIVCIFNISIFIVIRVILDSENEFNEPIIQGELRQLLTKFLGVFALSFCFGCYCCFCCMGNLFKWLTCCFHQQNRDNLVECWSSCMHHRQHVVEQMHKKSSTIFVTSRRNKVSAHTTDEFEIAQIRRGISTDESSDHKPHVHFTLGEQNESDELDADTHRKSPRIRPMHLTTAEHSCRTSNQWMEIHKPIIGKSAHETNHYLSPHHNEHFRRHSIGSAGQEKAIGFQNIHYYEIPVSLITPNSVAIVDPAFAANTIDSDDSNSTATAVLSPLSPTATSIFSSTSAAVLEPTQQKQVSVVIEEPK